MVFTGLCLLLSSIGGLLAVHIPFNCSTNPNIRHCQKGSRAGEGNWGYTDENGPATWAENFKEYCAGDAQSPIDIKTDTAKEMDVGMIKMMGYDKMMAGHIMNSGHSLNMEFKDADMMPYIMGGRLPEGEKFQFLQLHWHWGSDSSKGSEHTMDGKEYPLELHLVHWNTKYQDVGTAVGESDGLAVLGFFYEVTEEENEPLNNYLGAMEGIGWSYANKTSAPVEFKLRDLVPMDLFKYYYYQGGLTTPTCNEAVLWTNFKHTCHISEKQLQAFRKAQNKNSNPMANNYRPPQPLNGRVVYTNKAPECCTRKTVGDYEYVLLGEAMDEKEMPKECLSKCVYTRADKPGTKVCFKAGDLPVHCKKDMMMTTTPEP